MNRTTTQKYAGSLADVTGKPVGFGRASDAVWGDHPQQSGKRRRVKKNLRASTLKGK